MALDKEKTTYSENNRSVSSRLAKLRFFEYCSKKGVSKSPVQELKRI